MNRFPLVLIVLATATLGGFYAWARLRHELGGPGPMAPVVVTGPARHEVTPEMAVASREMLEREAPSFRAKATDGRAYALADLLRDGPVVLTFIKDGCPCSEAAQPFFSALRETYPGATVLGVIDVEADKARRWARQFRVAYPLLLDPDGRLVRDFGAENSAYVVVIDPDGRIARHWPGYSAPMLRELGATLATMTGTSELPLNLADAPDELYSGCPYEFEVGPLEAPRP